MHLKTSTKYLKFQLLTAWSMKMTALLDIVHCSLVTIHRRYRGIRAIVEPRIKAARTSATSFASTRICDVVTHKAVVFDYT
jgi:hypothetical protein